MIILDTMVIIKSILRWLPAVSIMVAIFGFSSLPSPEVPSFGLWDPVVEKGAHIMGYGLLALAFWYALRFDKRRKWLVLLLAVLYAITDEFHQSFVSGRHSSWVDVFIFDGSGASLMLLGVSWIRKRMR